MAEKPSLENAKPRPPVVAVVGHVDHGKTTLLDYIRKTNVAGGETGGITQSVGAYEIEHPSADSKQAPKKITFIDTPGHEAFSVMRARGASAADLAVLVVAADEGVKPQTKEALDILKQTKTPFVVAITKIDAPNADVERVKNELLSAEVLLEGAGGDISWQPVSGKTGEGVDELLNLILLAGEVAGLAYHPEPHGYGFVLESKKDSRRGAVAHVIIKDGTVRRGDEIVTKTVSGKVKILENFLGEPAEELIPSAPAAVVGWEDLPKAGEEFWTGSADIKVIGVMGKESAITRAAEAISELEVVSEETLKEEKGKKVKAVLKADSDGSLAALKQVLGARVETIGASVGEISDNDVKFAKSTGSTILGFRVSPTKVAERLAGTQGVNIITSEIIYELIEAAELLEKREAEEVTGGKLEVLATFSATATKQTVGGRVTEGKIRVGARAEIERGGEVIGKGRIRSIQLGKEDAKEVSFGSECGLVIETEVPIEKGDTLVIGS